MKFTALVAVAAAHSHNHTCTSKHHCSKNWKVYAIDALYRPLTGANSITDMCAEKRDYMETGLFWRQMIRDIHVAGVEALYQETDIVSDQCFGTWMIDAWHPVKDLYHALKDDFDTVERSMWVDAGSALLDIMYKNKDECAFPKIGDDIRHWAFANQEVAWKHKGWFNRVVENIIPLAWNTLDFWKTLKANDICATDQELINNYVGMYSDFCKSSVTFHGMELHWNNGLQTEDHISISQYKAKKAEFKKSHECWGKKLWSVIKSTMA